MTKPMIVWFAVAALMGTLTTTAYALIAYVILKRSTLLAGIVGSIATLVTFFVILLSIDPRDAGALFLGVMLVFASVIVGAPLGTLLLRFSVENMPPSE